MAYFPNGTAGEMFRERNCFLCVHGAGERLEDGAEPCPIMTLHLLWNYEREDEAKRMALDELIPEPDPIYAVPTCRLFLAAPSGTETPQP